MEIKNLDLDFATDCFIVVKFQGVNSAVLDVFPTNVSALQLRLAGDLLKVMGIQQMDEMNLRRIIREELSKSEVPKILKPFKP